jgi:hypothetical protein
VNLNEPVLRLGRRGRRVRPFSVDAQITNRCSLRLQRVLVDFGAESSFNRAALRVEEHYGIDVTYHALYTQTLKHGRAMGGFVSAQNPVPATELLTQIDGSMIPIMTPGKGADRRCGKSLSWGEVRLCSARVPGTSQPIYGASRGSCQTIALTWEHTAKQSGWTSQTRVHGVGDGAPWIADKFNDLFGDQGTYLIDYYHVSEYLAQASVTLKNTEAGATRWRRCQQRRLLKNQFKKVIGALEQEQPENPPDHPVTKAHRYLKERQEHLDYQGAQEADRPIGSGEIESGHRHVIQQRLKLAGAWWIESHIQPMLNLRVLRANQHWNEYSQTLQN